jgi:hypothetical protein
MLTKAKNLLAFGGTLGIIVQTHDKLAHALTLFNSHRDYFNLTSPPFSVWLNENGFSCRLASLDHFVPSTRFLSPSTGALTQSGADYASFLIGEPWESVPESKQGTLKFSY